MPDEPAPADTAITQKLSDAVLSQVDKIRKARGLTGNQLAQQAGIPQTSMSRKLNGHAKFDVDDVAAIASVFDVDAADLIAWAERELRSKE